MATKAPHLRPVPGGEDGTGDAELVRACADGDSRALGELFERHHRVVFRFLARMSGCDQRDLDDLVQNTFIEVNRGAPSFAGRSAVKSWILGIAHNVARNHIRGESRHKHAIRSMGDLTIGGGDSPRDAAERRRQIAALSRAIDELPFDLRAAFLLCGVEEISGKEAAKELGVPRGTIWRRLHEARAILAEKIGRRHA